MFIRKQCLIMSQNWNTPVSFWMDMPLRELIRWIDASNDLIEEQKQKK